jgi:putative flippase GtrA
VSIEASGKSAESKLRSRALLLDWIKRFVLHVVTGFAAVAVHYAVMWLLLRGETNALIASSVGFAGGALTRFLTAYYNVFEPTQQVRATVPKFLAALLAQGVLNSLFLTGLMETGISLWYAQIATTVAMTFLNYIVYRLWVFR